MLEAGGGERAAAQVGRISRPTGTRATDTRTARLGSPAPAHPRLQDATARAARRKVLAAVAGKAEAARQLAYRLYTLCERAGWAEDARAYNELITSWSGIESAAAAAPQRHSKAALFDD